MSTSKALVEFGSVKVTQFHICQELKNLIYVQTKINSHFIFYLKCFLSVQAVGILIVLRTKFVIIRTN